MVLDDGSDPGTRWPEALRDGAGGAHPPPDGPSEPPRQPSDRVDRNLPVGRILAFMALVVAVERLSMLTFVTGAGPALIAVGGSVFFVGNALLWWFGTAWFRRRIAAARGPRAR